MPSGAGHAISCVLAVTKLQFSVLAIGAFCLLVVILHARSVFTGPLARVPGPRWNAFTNLPYLKAIWQGNEVSFVNALHKEYGSVVRITPNLVAVIGNSQTWKQIYGFKSKGQPSLDKDLLFYEKSVGKTPGPISAGNDAHARMRKMLAPAFSENALRKYEHRLKHWAGCLKEKLEEQASSGASSDMVKMLHCATFDIMSDMTFAEPLHMLQEGEYSPWVELVFNSLKLFTYIRAIRYFNTLASRLLDIVIENTPSIVKTSKEHQGFVTARVDKRLGQKPDHPDIWSQVTQEASGAAELTIHEHYAIASELMLAGTETTASALSGIVFYLIQSPAWIDKLTKELRSQYADYEALTMSSLQSNRTLNAVIHEGLRMYPPLPTGLPRIVPKGGLKLGDYLIPGNTRLAVYQIPTYRAERNFLNAYEFRPERWLDDPEFKNDQLDAVEPFSVGPRNCLGKNFAWHEMRLLLATVLIHFDISILLESQDWADQQVFLVWEKRPLMCELTLV